MTQLFDAASIPSHLARIPSLDFTDELLVDPLKDQWFRLGAWTVEGKTDAQGVEDVVLRKSFLLSPSDFARIAPKLESVGNVVGNLGKPGGSVGYDGEKKSYEYYPFYRDHLFPTDTDGEPLAFTLDASGGTQLFVNPDIWMFLELEEMPAASGVWIDRKRGLEVIRRRLIENGNLQIVEVRVADLMRYLKARQLSLVVGHYRHLHQYRPLQSVIDAFVKEDVTLNAPGAKAVLQNWGLRDDFPDRKFLQRRLHLWFAIDPPAIDLDEPFADEPEFDVFALTIPTRSGPVAPARYRPHKLPPGRVFAGVTCDSTTHIYFRQEVLTKYENASGFTIEDNGSVRCHDYWGLDRSTHRVGNDLLSTMFCDFAEGVSVHEWPHWQQYAVEPPSYETLKAMGEEKPIPEAVTELVEALDWLNERVQDYARVRSLLLDEHPWRGTSDSLAVRQLKWVYPVAAHDDEFLKRATLLSTLVIDGLVPSPLRSLLKSYGATLHEKGGKPLGSRNLLQRLVLTAAVVTALQPQDGEVEELVRCAEGEIQAGSADLQAELVALNAEVRAEFAPLAFLYDLRTAGGVAHPPSPAKAGAAAQELGLGAKDWRRADYLKMLALTTTAVGAVNRRLRALVDMIDP